MRASVLAFSLLLWIGCDEGRERPQSAIPEGAVVPRPDRQVAEPAPAESKGKPVPEPATRPENSGSLEQQSPTASKQVPARACAVRSRTVLGPAPQLLGLVEVPSGLWLLRATDLVLEVAQLASQKLEIVDRLGLKSKLSVRPVGLSRADGSVVLSWIDERGDLSIVDVLGGKFGTPRLLGRGVDPRFEPTLAELSQVLLVAHTQTRDSAMHTMLTRLTGTQSKTVDVTPASHGACAAKFIVGTQRPALVMLDARAGVSPLLEVPLDARGEPLPAVVRTPVSQPYAPPALFVFELGGDTQAVFTAIGRAAATAIGIVSLHRAEAPRPLVPSFGYGALAFDVALGERGAVFVGQSPSAPSLGAKRDLLLKVLDAQGEGPSLTISSDGHSLSRPVVAREPIGRAFSLLYSDGPELVWLRLACDA